MVRSAAAIAGENATTGAPARRMSSAQPGRQAAISPSERAITSSIMRVISRRTSSWTCRAISMRG